MRRLFSSEQMLKEGKTMPIASIKQPEILLVDDTLRLRKFDNHFEFAFDWYQDTETVWLVDADRIPYTHELLGRMYHYLNDHGELYFIEVLENQLWKPIGDVTFWQEDMPIVIGDPEYRGRKIGTKVIAALIERGKQLGYERLYVDEIYSHNTVSRKCFESMGFRSYEATAKGNRFVLDLKRS